MWARNPEGRHVPFRTSHANILHSGDVPARRSTVRFDQTNTERPMTALPIPLTPRPLRVLRALRAWFKGEPPRAAEEVVTAPEALAHPLSRRAKRHMRNARASWW
jgi:hypothetical protein